MTDDPSLANSVRQLRARLRQIDEELGRFKILLHEKECIEQALYILEQIGKENSSIPIWQAAKEILARKGRPMTAKQVTDALLATGLKVEGKTPMESVRIALIRKGEIIERLPDGRFQLKLKKDS